MLSNFFRSANSCNNATQTACQLRKTLEIFRGSSIMFVLSSAVIPTVQPANKPKGVQRDDILALYQ
jgi:hypothetical protein